MSHSPRSTGTQRERKFWQAHIKAYKQSGFNRSEYCRRHDLSYHAMTYWLRKENKPSSSAPAGLNLVQVPFPLPGGEDANAPGISLHIGTRFTIELHRDFCKATLARVLAILEAG